MRDRSAICEKITGVFTFILYIIKLISVIVLGTKKLALILHDNYCNAIAKKNGAYQQVCGREKTNGKHLHHGCCSYSGW